MANEMLVSVSDVTDLFQSETLAGDFLYSLSPRGGIGLLTHPAFAYKAAGVALPSTVVKVPVMGIGSDLPAAHTPGTQVANTVMSNDHIDVTLAEYNLRYTPGDLARWAANGKLSAGMFAQALAIMYVQQIINLAANIGDDFTATAGGTGTALTWAHVTDAKRQLGEADATGPMVGLVSPRQWANLETDVASKGEVQAAAGMGQILNAGLDSYKGRYNGVDWFTSTHVPDDSTDYKGCLLTRGAIAWSDALIPTEGDPNIVSLGRAALERERNGSYRTTSFILSMVCGLTQGLDAAGVTLQSGNNS